MLWLLLLPIAAYLLGSIPFSYLIVKLIAGDDIRTHGSGNVGATNVARTVGKGPGIAALLLDIAKGWLAVILDGVLVESSLWPLATPGQGIVSSVSFWMGLAGALAVAGHMFPVWLGFKGGKGVATAAGVFLGAQPLALAFSGALFLIVMILTRYVSLASMISVASVPIAMRFLVPTGFWIIVFSTLIATAVIVKHSPNIARLAGGSEPRFPS